MVEACDDPDDVETFIRFLRNTIVDSMNQRGAASFQLKEVEQKKD